MKFRAGLDGVAFTSHESKLLGGFYKAAGETPRPTAVLVHGLPGIEKHLDVAYRLRDLGWNCLYFHFRGCWGSKGAFSIAGLADDTRAAVEWVRKQPSADTERIALIAGSTGSYPALLYAAGAPEIRAIAGISPLINPRAFPFPNEMADHFAEMLEGVTGRELQAQWEAMISLANAMRAFAPRPLLLVTADNDEIFPPSHYSDSVVQTPNLQWIRREESDHGFSSCRPWLVQTVTDWLVATLGN